MHWPTVAAVKHCKSRLDSLQASPFLCRGLAEVKGDAARRLHGSGNQQHPILTTVGLPRAPTDHPTVQHDRVPQETHIREKARHALGLLAAFSGFSFLSTCVLQLPEESVHERKLRNTTHVSHLVRLRANTRQISGLCRG